MTRMISALALVASMAAASVAQAGNVTLTQPIQAGSLHEGGVDMVIYYTDQNTHFEVVATYVTPRAPDAPNRLRMGLTDGDRVSFALPGEPATLYSFARADDTVTVETTSTLTIVAQSTE